MDEAKAVDEARRKGKLLGKWRFPSGNALDLLVWRGSEGEVRALCLWDTPPPLQAADTAHYRMVVRPEMLIRLQRFAGFGGRAGVIEF